MYQLWYAIVEECVGVDRSRHRQAKEQNLPSPQNLEIALVVATVLSLGIINTTHADTQS
ncbi:MAG: hypothetical protein V7K97_10980 [Nostoc sp.]|uniref:hypothetical protein n=1 Tax=Nostoc sp. TaxID=1180 RepID=UPI002FFB8955